VAGHPGLPATDVEDADERTVRVVRLHRRRRREAREFYAGLFGWPIGPGAGDYQAWITDGFRPWAGGMCAGRWVPYVVVDDLDAAAKQAVELGGRVVRDKTTGPAGTSITVADPGGAWVAPFRSRRPVTAYRRPLASARPAAGGVPVTHAIFDVPTGSQRCP
jgi:predicted enzyme related to lactoylglutathione lyase